MRLTFFNSKSAKEGHLFKQIPTFESHNYVTYKRLNLNLTKLIILNYEAIALGVNKSYI